MYSQVNSLTEIINNYPAMIPCLIVRRQRYIDKLKKYEDEGTSNIK